MGILKKFSFPKYTIVYSTVHIAPSEDERFTFLLFCIALCNGKILFCVALVLDLYFCKAAGPH